ncbi:MAG TPA: zinc dependent phospholipase C family protein [Burkholderiales bacterium]|nr:zinc dependent phospholipase C family protein [Burkholderiales bacterium]
MRARFFFSALAGTLFAPDTFAWGLQTHVFLAQWALAAVPLADPQVRAAVARLPRLVLAGACLPDLALAGRMLGLTAFRRAHQWSTLRRLAAACWDEERAIAVGYASHLLADVVAHNRFVPEHERRILNVPHVTHALCEWAMDEHLREGLTSSPADLLGADCGTLVQATTRTFRCREGVARRAILFLARADKTLRASRLPALCRGALRLVSGESHFGGYVSDAKSFVRQIEAVLRGAEPRLQPEPDQVTKKEAPAMHAPSTPPAITSLG